MIKLIMTTLAALTLLTGLSIAPAKAELTMQSTSLEICSVVSEYSANVMTIRQANGDIVELMNMSTTEEFTTVVKKAYARPLFQTKENKQREVMAFKNEIFIWCMERL